MKVDNIETKIENNSQIMIKRTAWIIVRNNRDVLCGFPKQYHFAHFNEIDNEPVVTYRSKQSALKSIMLRLKLPENTKPKGNSICVGYSKYTAVQVREIIKGRVPNTNTPEPKWEQLTLEGFD